MLKENVIHLGDCIELMEYIDDESIDMILCDLPSGRTRGQWDNVIPMGPLWEHYKRIIKQNGAIVLLAIQPFVTDLINAAGRKWFRYDWIWSKAKPTGWLNANRMPLRYHEHVLVFYNRLPVYHPQMAPGKPYTKVRSGQPSHYGKAERTTTHSSGEKYPASVLHFINAGCTFSPDRRLIHPSQKPVALLEYLIKTYTAEGELVLDNAIGSGSTAVAALKCNRRFVGIELDRGYYGEARARIRDFMQFGKKDPKQLIFEVLNDDKDRQGIQVGDETARR